MSLVFTNEIAAIRVNIWKHLAVLRKKDEYCNIVNEILSDINFDGLSEEDAQEYFKIDFDVIYENVIDIDEPDFLMQSLYQGTKKWLKKLG